MGKTNPTYREMVESQIEDWSRYRRALRKKWKAPFESVTKQMRMTDMAGGQQNPIEPRWTMFLSLFISYEERISELEQTVEELEATIEQQHAEQPAEETFS
ncbi:hypothetical protein [Haloparvum sp. AD34]